MKPERHTTPLQTGLDLDRDIVESLVEGGWSREEAEAELQALKEWAADE